MPDQSQSLNSLSPLDGRYADDLAELSAYFSEKALIQYRVKIEIEYLIALSQIPGIPELPPLSSREQGKMRKLVETFKVEDAIEIKKIEADIHHDVKAVEYFLRPRLEAIVSKTLTPWIHFALTSEDVNNLAYALMWQDALMKVYLPRSEQLLEHFKRWAHDYSETSLLALTHGQPATPTTFGKEINVFYHRLKRQYRALKNHRLTGKLNGATGTWGAHLTAYPEINWIQFSRRFISGLGLKPNDITTQVEPNDSAAESYHVLVRIHTILIDFCRDIWFYISRGLLSQDKQAGEVGSSTMPHKVNPIHFENAEGNLLLANALLNELATTLPISRLQRDLSGSTTKRNQGTAMGYAILAMGSLTKGLGRISINDRAMAEELDQHWEVLAEAVQTILRKHGQTTAYQLLKDFSRGETITRADLANFITTLKIPLDEKRKLLSLTPADYIGLAPYLARLS
ncbi:MAG: adenylosuccinate lyase [Fidelibacterota bacterium]